MYQEDSRQRERLRSSFRNHLTGLVVALLLTAAAPATAIEVTGGFSGWWGQPDQQNHGMIIVVSRRASGEKQGVLYWAHYTNEGQPSWLIAQGPIDGDTINAELFRFEGIGFMQPQGPNGDFGEQIGTMDVVFDDCTVGDVAFDSTDAEIGAGTFIIERLSNQPGTSCSGGISDDLESGDAPQSFDIALVPTGAFPDASGRARLDMSPGRVDFEIEVENLPEGLYDLIVGGESRGEIEVTAADGGTEGELDFRSPQTPGNVLLDFDPRGQIIDVAADGEVLLTALAPTEGDFPGNGPPPFDPPGGSSVQIEVGFDNLGVYPDGLATAEFEMSSPHVDFEVELEAIPEGAYPLFVGGIKRGDIVVAESDDGINRGRLEFHFPPTGGQPFFDFDPRGELLEIVEGATLLFSVEFPASGDNGDDNGDGDSGDDGDGDGNSVVTRLELDLDNLGVHPDGTAVADFMSNPAMDRFVVRLTGVPAGDYALLVDGVDRGVISVTDDDGDTEGHARFLDPANPSGEPLDFDPRGVTIEVLDGDTPAFFGDFPE